MRFFDWLSKHFFKEPEPYYGWTKWYPTDEEWAALSTDPSFVPKVAKNWKNNEYVLAYTVANGSEKLSAQYCYESGKLVKFGRSSISYDFKQLKLDEITTPEEQWELVKGNNPSGRSKKQVVGKSRSKDTTKVITPRNDQQVCAFHLLKDRSKTIKLISGTWGTGKTMMLVGAALDALCKSEIDQIVWIRNNIDVKDTKDLGAFPGGKNEKLLPFLGPFIDHAGKKQVEKMLISEQLIIEPLQSLRGRSFKNSIIICTECENLTKEHIQLIIARAAEGSEVWLDGDSRQRDKAVFERSQGLEKLIGRFSGKRLFGYIHLIKSERSATAAMADLLDD